MQTPQTLGESFMRSNVHAIVCKPGKAAPTILQLLLARFETCVTDVGLKPAQITVEAVQCLIRTVPEPILADPLASLARPQLVIKAIYNLLWPITEAAINSDITALKTQIIDIVLQSTMATKPIITGNYDAIITPYMIGQHLRIKDFFNEVQIPFAIHPLEPLSIQGRIIEALRQRIKQQNEMSISSFAKLSLEDFKSQITGNTMMLLISDQRTSSEADGLETRIDVNTLLNPCVAQAELALYTSTISLPQELRTLVQHAAMHNPIHRDLLSIAAEDYLTNEHRPPLHILTNAEAQNLINALEQMPIVDAMYKGTLGNFVGVSDVHLKSMDIPPETQKQAHFEKYMEQFGKNVTQGLTDYSVLVEQSRRPPEQHVAQIMVCLDEVKTRIIGSNFVTPSRASSAREANKVRLSVIDKVPTIVHELGHQVEFRSSSHRMGQHPADPARTLQKAIPDRYLWRWSGSGL